MSTIRNIVSSVNDDVTLRTFMNANSRRHNDGFPFRKTSELTNNVELDEEVVAVPRRTTSQ